VIDQSQVLVGGVCGLSDFEGLYLRTEGDLRGAEESRFQEGFEICRLTLKSAESDLWLLSCDGSKCATIESC